jgi:hypothetical protein
MPSDQRTHLRFRIEPQLQDRLEKARKKSGRTLTGEIAERLNQSFEHEAMAQVREAVEEVREELGRESLGDIRAELRVVREELRELRAELRDVRYDLSFMTPEKEEQSFSIPAKKDDPK